MGRDRLQLTFLFWIACSWIHAMAAFGGNPYVLPSGSVLKWPTMEIMFNLDQGSLGVYSEETAQQLAIKAFSQWSSIPYSNLTWSLGQPLPSDVTEENIHLFFNQANDGINPVIFDTDGSIIELLQGEGASDTILGLGSPIVLNDGTILEAEMVLNGKLLTGTRGEIETLLATILHEIGHMCGLDHTQLFSDFAFDNNPSNNVFLPIMFPVEPKDKQPPQLLTDDDRMTLAGMYPTERLSEERAQLEGSVMRPWFEPVQGANVVAVNVEKPLVSAYAVISDLYIEQTGGFVFSGLEPGNYEIFIEPIREEFVGLSRVGPFSNLMNSPSFIYPVIEEYYNGGVESGYKDLDDPNDRVRLSLGPGEVLSGIDFFTNEEYSTRVNDWMIYSPDLENPSSD